MVVSVLYMIPISVFYIIVVLILYLLHLLIIFPLFIISSIISINYTIPNQNAMFPFYYWLPEVHCEANTSISLLLAGIVLKLSIYGILRFILTSFLA